MRGSRSLRFATLCLISLLAGAPALPAAAFDPSNLVVLRAAPTGAFSAARVFLDEYTTTGQLADLSVALPYLDSDPVRLTQAGGAATEGSLSRSADGRFLTLVGYDAPAATLNVAGTSNPRTIARVDGFGQVELSTTTNYSGQTIRSATSTDGNKVWVGNAGGVRFINFGSATGPVVATGDVRALHVIDGQLYGTTANSIFKTIDPLPEGPGGVTTIASPTDVRNPTGFVLLDRDPGVAGVDTLYVADQSLGLLKFSFNGTTWTPRGTIGGTLVGITGVVNGTSADLYVITTGITAPAFLRKLTDTAAFNADITGSYTTLAMAPSNQAFRSVAFAPVPEPTSLLLGAASAAGLATLALRRRRRAS
jgi:hypothetical protein